MYGVPLAIYYDLIIPKSSSKKYNKNQSGENITSYP